MYRVSLFCVQSCHFLFLLFGSLVLLHFVKESFLCAFFYGFLFIFFHSFIGNLFVPRQIPKHINEYANKIFAMQNSQSSKQYANARDQIFRVSVSRDFTLKALHFHCSFTVHKKPFSIFAYRSLHLKCCCLLLVTSTSTCFIYFWPTLYSMDFLFCPAERLVYVSVSVCLFFIVQQNGFYDAIMICSI